ncbi:YceD family protein [Teichococcus oryzae]|uniref:DUF177 domain-containing protein n=1 Tax=Teichococcus oryzae TaxID=1608942 RepID=A0A5B2TDV2_9PROT|nr:DUF177 domain-containing protein [Pseudoroseomonas oryzae]KAA2212667.1 DUF177 domain-containing protein [Pseudoroseomonas oryzae]
MTLIPEAEFPRPLPFAAVPPEGRSRSLFATPEECAALAKRFGIPAVERLQAELELRPEPGGTVRVRGTLEAAVVQSCVVTLEPVAQSVREPVDLRFLPRGEEPGDDPDGPDEIPTEDGIMELGEALAEQLSLALDPYPRAPGAELPAELAGSAEEAEAPRPSPFAILKGGKAPR